MATKNLFDPAQPAKETFVGRTTELNEFVHGLRDGKSYELTGPVGIGKTNLLLEIQRRMLADPACGIMSPAPLPVYVQCSRQHQREGLLFATIADSLAESLSQHCGRLCPAKVQREVESAAEDGRLSDVLEAALHWAFKETKRSFRVVLILDALHRISEKAVLRSLLGSLNNKVDRQTANVLLAGRHPIAQIDPRPEMVSNLKMLLSGERILEPFSEGETAALLDLAAQLDWPVAAGSAEVAHEIACGHPYRLQYYLHASLEQHEEITPKTLLRIDTEHTKNHLNGILTENNDVSADANSSSANVSAGGKTLAGSQKTEPQHRRAKEKLTPPDGASTADRVESITRVVSMDLVGFLATVDRFYVSQYIVAGNYVRYATEDVQHLKSEAVRIMNACTNPSRDRENFFVWGHPGEGKTFFVSELADQLNGDYVEINLSKSKTVPDAKTLSALLNSVAESEKCVLCALDEIDKRPEASKWLYPTIFPFLDCNKNKPHPEDPNTVFVLLGSKQPDFTTFQEEIRGRDAGKDLIRRIVHSEITIPRLAVGDRMVTALNMIWASRPESNKIAAANTLALAHLLATHPTNGAIAEATGKALAQVKSHETSFTVDHLNLKVKEWEAFHKRFPSAKDTLLERYVQMHS